MGSLTTFTIYNDGIDSIKTNSEEFCTTLFEAAVSRKVQDFGHGSYANLVHVQKCRHADDYTMYIHMGNCVTELNPYSEETLQLIKEHPQYVKSMMVFVQNELTQLKKIMKEMEQQENTPCNSE
jgi:hypothetical protein